MPARASAQTGRTDDALWSIDLARVRLSRELDAERRGVLGQYLTPIPVARHLAGMLPPAAGDVRVADPGAGIGSLGAAVVSRFLGQEARPASVTLTAWELEPAMSPGLKQTMETLAELCEESGVTFTADVRDSDFLEDGVRWLADDPLDPGRQFDAIIMNPPYRKIHSRSPERALCRRIGLETSNLYAAFLAVAADLLRTEGEMAAIVPRSFANGTYFKPFRQRFNARMTFREVHVYDSRSKAFADDAVLQENVIFRAVKTARRPDTVTVTSSAGPDDHDPTHRDVPYRELIRPSDEDQVIHIVADSANQRVAERVASLPCSLSDLGIRVSTGRVVEFRAREFLQADPGVNAVPLIHPGHFRRGRVSWPARMPKKNNAILNTEESAGLLVPEGLYVLTRRFSAKEERRRIVAALYDPEDAAPGPVGFENHLNYYHAHGSGLDRDLALGLRTFLNSTLVDLYFRQFSGHTQVNAGDLRRLRYPSREQLRRLGRPEITSQRDLDLIVDRELFADHEGPDPVSIRHRVDEALELLRKLGVPRGRRDEKTALTLLALLGLGPDTPWGQASGPVITTPEMTDFLRKGYGKTYAPRAGGKTRVDPLCQFVVVRTGDSYQIAPEVLKLARAFS